MPVALKQILYISALFFLITFLGCNESTTLPPHLEDLEADFSPSFLSVCPEMSYAVTVNANRSLDYVTFKVDGQEVFTDHEEPFQFFWNLALWADGSFQCSNRRCAHGVYTVGCAYGNGNAIIIRTDQANVLHFGCRNPGSDYWLGGQLRTGSAHRCRHRLRLWFAACFASHCTDDHWT